MNPVHARMIRRYFRYEHLPPALQRLSAPFCDLARALTNGEVAGAGVDFARVRAAIDLLAEGMESTGTGTLHYHRMRDATIQLQAVLDGSPLALFPDGVDEPELTVALRKLLEAKDAAVRAGVPDKHEFTDDDGVRYCDHCGYAQDVVQGHHCSGQRGILGPPVRDAG